MLVDPEGFLLVCAVCTVIGYCVGWMGGVVEGRQRERAALGVKGHDRG